MSYTTDDLDRLKRMRASGVLNVTEGGRRIEYRSMSELNQAIAAIEAEIGVGSALYPSTSTLIAERL